MCKNTVRHKQQAVRPELQFRNRTITCFKSPFLRRSVDCDLKGHSMLFFVLVVFCCIFVVFFWNPTGDTGNALGALNLCSRVFYYVHFVVVIKLAILSHLNREANIFLFPVYHYSSFKINVSDYIWLIGLFSLDKIVINSLYYIIKEKKSNYWFNRTFSFRFLSINYRTKSIYFILSGFLLNIKKISTLENNAF